MVADLACAYQMTKMIKSTSILHVLLLSTLLLWFILSKWKFCIYIIYLLQRNCSFNIGYFMQCGIYIYSIYNLLAWNNDNTYFIFLWYLLIPVDLETVLRQKSLLLYPTWDINKEKKKRKEKKMTIYFDKF